MFKVCRNCNCPNAPTKRKCRQCGGNRFDQATPEQIAADVDRCIRLKRLAGFIVAKNESDERVATRVKELRTGEDRITKLFKELTK